MMVHTQCELLLETLPARKHKVSNTGSQYLQTFVQLKRLALKSQGADVVACDLGNEEQVTIALQGAYAVFGLTNCQYLLVTFIVGMTRITPPKSLGAW
jgi:hypothetical protein